MPSSPPGGSFSTVLTCPQVPLVVHSLQYLHALKSPWWYILYCTYIPSSPPGGTFSTVLTCPQVPLVVHSLLSTWQFQLVLLRRASFSPQFDAQTKTHYKHFGILVSPNNSNNLLKTWKSHSSSQCELCQSTQVVGYNLPLRPVSLSHQKKYGSEGPVDPFFSITQTSMLTQSYSISDPTAVEWKISPTLQRIFPFFADPCAYLSCILIFQGTLPPHFYFSFPLHPTSVSQSSSCYCSCMQRYPAEKVHESS